MAVHAQAQRESRSKLPDMIADESKLTAVSFIERVRGDAGSSATLMPPFQSRASDACVYGAPGTLGADGDLGHLHAFFLLTAGRRSTICLRIPHVAPAASCRACRRVSRPQSF